MAEELKRQLSGFIYNLGTVSLVASTGNCIFATKKTRPTRYNPNQDSIKEVQVDLFMLERQACHKKIINGSKLAQHHQHTTSFALISEYLPSRPEESF